jgi:hypothetical protein
VLLRCTASGLYRVHWSSDVLEEVKRTLVHQIGIGESRVHYLLETMARAFPEAEVEGYAQLIAGLEVDPGDRHVAAAATIAGADLIVTRNVRHFPDPALAPFNLKAQLPDEFLMGLAADNPGAVRAIIEERASDLGDSLEETLDFLRQHVPGFVASLEHDR